MGANSIEIYRKNSATIICTVTGLEDLVDYVATLTAKVNKNDTTAVITKVGSIIGLVITFILTSAETDKAFNILNYDIVIAKPVAEEDPIVYTVVQDVLEIKKSIAN